VNNSFEASNKNEETQNMVLSSKKFDEEKNKIKPMLDYLIILF